MPSPRTARFGAVVTAMVTPFDDEGELDIDAAVNLARWLADHGSDGLVLAGSTGEGTSLTDQEKLQLWGEVGRAVTIPVLAGTGTADTAHSIELSKHATAAGVAGLLVVTPYYSRPSQAGLIGHFEAVASATELPVLLYDIPVCSGRRIEHETMLHLANQGSNIVGVKAASGNLSDISRLVAQAPRSFEVYSGDDPLTLPIVAVGGVGIISVISHWAGVELGELVALTLKGDLEGAQLVDARLQESYSFMASDQYPNPVPAKAVCRRLGLPVGQCRLPLGAVGPELDEAAGQMLARLGVIDG